MGNPIYPTHVETMFPSNNEQVVLVCPHVLFSSKLHSAPMTIWTWCYRVQCSVEAILRKPFVLASFTHCGRLKWRDKTEAVGKLNRKWTYQLAAASTDTVGKRRGTGWQVWLGDIVCTQREGTARRDDTLIDETSSNKAFLHCFVLDITYFHTLV